MFSSFKKFSGTALALVLLSSPVYAADVNAEGATALKALIQTQLDLRKNVQAAAGGAYITEGDIKVEPAGNYYAVTFPHTKIKDATGKTYDIGMIAANVIPGATPNEWKAAIAIPTPIKVIGADNKPAGQFDIGKQQAVGIWDTNLSSFVRLDAKYDDLTYQDEAKTIDLKISNAAIKNMLTRSENGNLSGPASGTLSDWVITSTEDKTSATIKEVRFDVNVKDFDPKIAKSFNEQIGAIGQSGSQITDATASDQHDVALYNLLTDVIGKSSDAFSVKTSISDLALTTLEGEDKKDSGFNLGYGSLGFDMSGFRAGSVKTGVQVKYTDLSFKDKADPDVELIPLNLNFDISVNNLPFDKLVDEGRMALTSGHPEFGLINASQILTAANTNISHSFDAAAQLYKAKGNGVINANIKGMMGYTAEQYLELEGLDKIITRVNEEIKNATPEEAEALQSTLGPMTIMQMVGQKDEKNPDLRTYKVVVNEQGQMLLNGSDMSALLGGATPATAPAEEPEASPAQ